MPESTRGRGQIAENAAPRRGICLVISAPSGVGKSTVTRALLEAEPGLSLSVSVTTRRPRPGEREGVDYYYRTAAEFERLVLDGALLEWAEVYGRKYGTPRASVEAALGAGRDTVFDIDWQGARALRTALPGDVVSVFLLPPSATALRERLVRRAGDAPAEIERRLQAAAAELSRWREFDHLLVNDALDRCVGEVRSILSAARTAAARQIGLAEFADGLM